MFHVPSLALPYIDSDPVEFRLLPIAIGTNLGGASVDLETGTISWFLHCKSDVFAQQIGNVILCGLRNGAIVTVDSRESRESLSGRLITHRIPYTSSDKKVGGSNKEWFKLKGDIYPSHTIRMPSSISCLASLQFDDQYFLASSMDGSVLHHLDNILIDINIMTNAGNICYQNLQDNKENHYLNCHGSHHFLLAAYLERNYFLMMGSLSFQMRLYDLRLLQRGAVQCYEGHVNSHTRIQIGVDPSERFVMSGGEDCKLRLWSIKSGELLFEDKFSDSVISTVCYKTYGHSFKAEEENQYKRDSSQGAWLGSLEGLFYMCWL
ncbi:DDB1- and CUL4-associated factor 4-like protein 2 [Glycine max]|nr:DDB1- and CUL4-associated factor 4-like protein 2 [Glycine max]